MIIAGMPELFIFIAVIAVVIVTVLGLRVWMGMLDHERISKYVVQRGGEVDEIIWTPFACGWFGSKDERIYRVVYRDGQLARHRATCKTSMFSGVYWTSDEVTDALEGLPPRSADVDLVAENRRLRAEIEQLRRSRP